MQLLKLHWKGAQFFFFVYVYDKFLITEEVVQAYQVVGTTYMLHQKQLSVNGSSCIFNQARDNLCISP